MTAPQLFDLTGRIALITGGSRGLGEEIAEGLGRSRRCPDAVWPGARPGSIPPSNVCASAGFRCESALCDVADAASVAAAVAKTIEHFGRIDILINNAGVTWGAPAEDMPLERWRAVLDVNLTGAFLCAQAAGREMIRQGSGVDPECVVGGGLARHAGRHPLRRVCRVQGWPDRADARTGRQMGSVRHSRELHRSRIFSLADVGEGAGTGRTASVAERIPMGRIGRTGELKGIAVFLASDASSYITGQTIAVDGGATVT